MGQDSKIEWCEHTFNPWMGCTKVSPACAHCYAESWAKRSGLVEWGPGRPRRRASDAKWKEVRKWNAEAAALPQRPRVFCASLADWLDDEVPIEWLADLLALIHETKNLDWLLLTKRPQNWHHRVNDAFRLLAVMEGGEQLSWTSAGRMVLDWLRGYCPDNVWLGTTVEDQARAEERIPHLLALPAKVRFLSCEPLLGPVDLSGHSIFGAYGDPGPEIHWVIGGGESGPGARPMHPDWARRLRDQCQQAGVPFFFKQWGEFAPSKATGKLEFPDKEIMTRVGKKAAGRELDGRAWDQRP